MHPYPIYSSNDVQIQYVAGYVLPKDDGNPDPRTLPYDLEEAIINYILIYFSQEGTSQNLTE